MFETPEEIQRYLATQAAWQNQLENGANIANAGWQTAMGLALGTGLGNWLGHQFGNWQRARDDRVAGMTPATINPATINPVATQRAIKNLFGTEFDLGWKPQENPYRFPTAQETFAKATTYTPSWQNFMPSQPARQTIQQTNPALSGNFNLGYPPPPNYNFPVPNVLSGVGWQARTPYPLQKFF